MQTPNEALIEKFYTSFQQKNYQAMQECYTDEASFNDPIFKDLNANETKLMWQMLISRSRDLEITYSNIKEEDDLVTAQWEARYTFTATGQKIFNKVKATFEIKDGKIVKHTDHFNFYKWAKQAFGGGGLLLGWTTSFKERVSKTAKQKLEEYLEKLSQQ